jgi:hypothetical protein
MADPIPPYFVLFAADRIPTQIDHTQANPGGENTGGHTSVLFDGRGALTFVSDTSDPRPDGTVAFFFRSVNVIFRLTDFAVAVSSDYPVGSCAYDATLRHEINAHVRGPIGIMYGFRDPLIARLNTVHVPTRAAPQRVPQADVARIQSAWQQQVFNIVGAFRRDVSRALAADRTRQDSRASYQRVYDQCPAVEWRRGS